MLGQSEIEQTNMKQRPRIHSLRRFASEGTLQLEIIINAGSHVYDLYMSIFLSTFVAKEPERIMKISERCCNSRSPPSSHAGTKEAPEGQAGGAPSHKINGLTGA